MLLQRPAKRGALFNLNEMFEMKENLIPVHYKVESEAYRALSEMKRETTNHIGCKYGEYDHGESY